jgi:hypothetical protein
MTTAYKHRPMSEILAKPAAQNAEGPTDTKESAPAAPKAELPEKYRGKTVDEVAEMHRNSESRLGQLQNEVGQLRGLVSDLSAIQRPSQSAKPVEEEPVEVSSEDLLSNPVEAVRRIVQPDFAKRDKAIEAETAATLVRTESAALLTDFGNIDDIVSTEDFQKFATRTNSRKLDFQTAATGEGLDQVRAARRLLEDYQDFQAQTTPKAKEPTPTERARAVATKGATTGAPISSKPQIFESDVIALINSDPAKYRSPSYQNELLAAIREKRFVSAS